MAIIGNINQASEFKDVIDTKDTITNVVKRIVDKSIREAGYDKTILATIQCCVDSTLGQYKIKYQNGFFTAYALDKNVIYNNQASVYVKVSNNDMSKRMHIIGLATDDSDDRQPITYLEGDQMFGTIGLDFIKKYDPSRMKMLTYEGGEKYYSKTLYNAGDNHAGIVQLISNSAIKQELLNAATSNGNNTKSYYFRLGCDFKTAFDSIQKEAVSGNYGIKVVMDFQDSNGKKYSKDYIIDTFNMEGTPFSFNSFTSQYHYWEINANDFVQIRSITIFTEGFEEPTQGQELPNFDIFLDNLTMKAAIKYYKNEDDEYRVKITSLDKNKGTTFDGSGEDASEVLRFAADLTKLGKIISPKDQNLKYFWGRQDSRIKSVNNKRYNKYLGKGWACLNTGYKKNYSGESYEDLGDCTILNTDPVNGKYIEWKTDMREIGVPRSLCKNKETPIKCVIVYENTAYESPIVTLTNPIGYYLLATDKSTINFEFKTGAGSDTIVVGLFKRNSVGGVIVNKTFDQGITYEWTIYDTDNPSGATLPLTDPNQILQYNQDWIDACTDGVNPDDNITKTDAQIDAYYDEKTTRSENMRLSLNRYNYYAQNFGSLEPEEKSRVIERKKAIIYGHPSSDYIGKIEQIFSYYKKSYANTLGYYILGSASIENNQEDFEKDTFKVDEYLYYGTPSYDRNHLNTLYNLQGSKINGQINIEVSALLDGEAIATINIPVKSGEGNGLDYDLRIINGDQSFIYSTGGYAPTSADNNQHPMTLQPLYFQFYDKGGRLLYDSQQEESEQQSKNVEGYSLGTLNPEWTTYDNKYSLIQTAYNDGHNSTVEGKIVTIKDKGSFVYTLANTFNIKLRDYSNVNLKVTYKGVAYYATTHFNFGQQGDLGTNGTENVLEIQDVRYEDYVNDVLSGDDYCKFKTQVDNVETEETFLPSTRFLKNTYLYATQAYDANYNRQSYIEESTYVDLYFAQSMKDADPEKITGATSINLYGFWYDESEARGAVDGNTKWFLPIEMGTIKKNNQKVEYTPSFSLKSNKGTNTIAEINYVYEGGQSQEPKAFKPSKIMITKEGTRYEKIANNVIGMTSSREVTSQIDEITGETVKRSNDAYYPIPFYFYSAYDTNENLNKADGLNPAMYICLTGGFDSVKYNGAGMNPVYSQEPFTLHFFDTEHNEITEDIIKSSNGSITWDCSNGFTFEKKWNTGGTNIGTVKAKIYPNEFDSNEQLYGQYCKRSTDGGNTYEYYKCIHKHTKSNKIVIKETGMRYNPGDFVEPYWVKVNALTDGVQTCYFKPLPTYNSLAASSLFNSWISVTVKYWKNNIQYSGQVFIPINVICNQYGSEEINGWNGKSTKMGDSYILSSKVGAGVKTANNSFAGITIGETFYPDEGKSAVGLFGYGGKDSDTEKKPIRTIFMDAYTGRTFLGKSGGSQIILNPQESNDQVAWSKLSGWYFSKDYLYKVVGEGVLPPTDKDMDFGDYEIKPAAAELGSVGMYVPYETTVTGNDVFLWATSKDRDPDLDDIVEEMQRLQTEMGRSGIQFKDDFTMINDEKVVKDLKQMIKTAQHCLDWQRFVPPESITQEYPEGRPYWETVDVTTMGQASDEQWDIWASQTGLSKKKDYPTLLEENVMVIAACQAEDPSGHYDSMTPKVADQVMQIFTRRIAGRTTELNGLLKLIDEYEQYLSTYTCLKKSLSNGNTISWDSSNKKKANFYVTYGGHLHAESADVSGKIVAQTGQFGSGLNKILISTVKDGRKYLLYNKNFWVGDDENGDPEIFMKGTIQAKSGQFGEVGDDVTGYSGRTVFIEYPWYSWKTPEPNEPFNDNTFYLDTSKGKNKTYALYHRNFNIDNRGDILLNGKIFCKDGRIGNWVIGENDLRDYTGNIILHPDTNSTIEPGDHRSYILLGNTLKLQGDGAIDGPTWNITAEGEAHFTNSHNTFDGSRFTVKGDQDVTLSNQGLYIPPGGHMQIGSQYLTASDDGLGFRFYGIARFTQGVNLENNLNFTNNNGKISFPGQNGTQIDQAGISFTGASTNTKIDARGISFGSGLSITSTGLIQRAKLDISSCTISGPSELTIEQYINKTIDDKIRAITPEVTRNYDGDRYLTNVEVKLNIPT